MFYIHVIISPEFLSPIFFHLPFVPDYISDRGIDPIVYVSYYLDQEARETMYKVENIQQWLDRLVE